METTMTSKGQIVIPSSLRRKFGLKEGVRIQLLDDGEQIVLKPITPQYVRKLRGILKGSKGMQALIEDRQMEKER
jgi:AbrB family looped-hinge helix DNA binding protein